MAAAQAKREVRIAVDMYGERELGG